MTASKKKVALITGAAKRIGRAIAIGMAQRGWDVAVHYGNSADEAQATVKKIQALGRRAHAFQCDLSNESAVRSLLDQVHKQFGSISCVVNNASLFEEDHAATFSGACLDRHMHANVMAPILLAQSLHAATPEGEQACVINLLDQKLYNPNPDFLSYTLSKAALQSATVLLAQALAPKVRVVGVAPGLTMVSGEQTPENFLKAHTKTPLGRSSTPEDIVAAVSFVAEAGAITGTTILVDGGQHLMPSQRDVMFLEN